MLSWDIVSYTKDETVLQLSFDDSNQLLDLTGDTFIEIGFTFHGTSFFKS